MILFECKNLSLGYGSTLIQENLNFSVEKGDYFFILGENGSGKSTLLKTILGFLKPFSGKIEYSDLWNKKSIGYLPQASEIQKTFPATVWEIVLSGCQSDLGFFPFYTKKHILKAEESLKCLGIYDYRKRSFKELSGGQQQRVLFARAICAAGEVLVLDEPAKGFDLAATQKMYEIVQDLLQASKTVITISHDLEAAEKYGSKIITLQKREALK